MLAAFYVGGVAKADTQRTFKGRWVAIDNSLTLDLSPCGDGWCGIEVTKAGGCGRTMLRARNEDGQLTGQFELTTQSWPLTTTLHLFRRSPSDPDMLKIRGHTGGQSPPWRRIYPYTVELARTSDVTCRPDPKVS
jgi:hypothetical protein